MKILMLTDSMDIGGAETHVYELSRALSFWGHDVRLLADGGYTAKLLEGAGVGLEVTELFSARHLKLLAAIKKLLSVLREFKPDVVHAHTRRTLFVAEVACAIVPFPLVFTAHAKFSTSFAKRILTKPPAHSIAVSEDIRAHFLSVFGAKEMAVVENGIDTERFSPAPSPAGGVKIVTVSRLDRDSSLSSELLCRIAPRLAALFPDLEITVVGGGNDFSRIALLSKSVNRQLGKDVIHAVGAQSDVLPYLQGANLFVGVSRAALEAMCVGLPVIICGNEGFFGICDRENFDVCAKENFCARGYAEATEDALFEAIIKVLRQKKSASLRESVQAKYETKTTAGKVLAVYKNAVSDFRAALRADVTLCGYYGFGNLGDELVLSQIKNVLGSRRIAVIGARGVGRTGRLEILRTIGAIRSSRIFILGGGSLLQNSTSRRSLVYYLALLRIAAFFGKKIILYANGLGPINGEGAQKNCRRALLTADSASFRDSRSFELSRALLSPRTPIRLTCDPALLLDPRMEVRQRIAVFVRGEDASDALTERIKKALLCFRREVSEDVETVFASMNRKKDNAAAIRLAGAMPFPTEYRLFEDCGELVDFVASSFAVVSGRLHALIVAAAAGRPFIALCHDPKLEAFAADCEMPPELMLRLDSKSLDAELFEALRYVFENREDLERDIAQRVTEMRTRAKEDSKEIERMLE